VKALRIEADGSVLVLAVRGSGEIIGDITVLGDSTRNATVIAVDRCETRIVPVVAAVASDPRNQARRWSIRVVSVASYSAV